MSSDPIADMLTIIRNGGAANKKVVSVPLSKIKVALLDILKEEGYVGSYIIEERTIKVTLKYYGKNFAITKIKKISKPGVRIYTRSKAIPEVLGGQGLTVVSTSKGLMNEKQAKLQKLGGEVICQVS